MAKLYAEFASVMIGMNRKEFWYEDKIVLVAQQMKNLGIPSKVQKMVINHMNRIQSNLDSQKGLNIFLNTVPPSIKLEVIEYMV